jgi:hypothetical protein
MMTAMTMPSLARVLVAARVADNATLGQASAIAAEGGVPLVFALVRWRLVEAGALASALARALHIDVTALDQAPSPPPVGLVRSVCARLRILALGRRGDVVVLGMSDPTDDDTAGQVAAAFGVTVERRLVDDDELERALRQVYPRGDELLPAAPPIQALRAQLPVAPSSPGFRSLMALPDVGSGSGSSSSVSSSTPSLPPAPSPSAASPAARLPSGSSEVRTIVTPPPTRAPSPAGPAVASPPLSPPTVVGALSGVDDSASSFAVSVIDAVAADLPSDVFADAPLPSVTAPTGGPTGMLFTERASERSLGTRPVGWDAPNASQDVTIPADVLSVLKLLVVADPVVGRSVEARLRPVLRELAVVHRLEDAQHVLATRTFNEVAIVDPADTVAASQALAVLAARQKRGVLVVSQRNDFARLPGVRIVPCSRSDDVVGVITAALHAAARA